MATRVSVNGGASGVGLPGTTSTQSTSNNDLSQSLESNSSFDSDILPSFLPDAQTKKRRKQSRPSRIPLSDSDINPLNLSKGQGPPPTQSPAFFLNQPPFAALFASAPPRETGRESIPEGGSGGGSHGSSVNSTNAKEQGTLILPPNRIFNPEAYCDLCNKEFCNKYFLKTHKANKHGVYSDVPPTNGSCQPHSQVTHTEYLGDPNLGRRSVRPNDTDEGGNLLDDDPDEEGLAFNCNFCGSEFTTEAELRNHLGEKHGLVVPPFLLPFPPTTTPPPTSLFDLPKNSPSEVFDCSRCSRSFSTLYLLRMHTSYFHPPTPPPSNNNNKEEDSIKEECLSPEETGETTSDSDELRRLQSMIMDLNPLGGSLTSGDGVTGWNNNSPSPHGPAHPLTLNNTGSSTPICPLCAKEFYSPTFLAQHMEQSHGGAALPKDEDASKMGSDSFLLPNVAGVAAATAAGTTGSSSSSLKGERRPSPSLSRSYCTICHKELCNKYFMRTHMLKMHGISIESSTGLGGVTCDICNKELCSKYFLKVHKQNTHGILDEGPSPPVEVPELVQVPLQATQTQTNSNSNEPLPLDLHAPSEGCPICSKRFRSVKWLKNHLLTDHGQEGRDAWKVAKKTVPLSPKNNNGKSRSRGSRARNGTSEDELGSKQQQQQQQQRLLLDPLSIFFGKLDNGDGGSGSGSRVYRCNYCPFTTTMQVYHFAHERSHTGLGAVSTRLLSDLPNSNLTNFQCPMCFQGVGSLEAFQQHLFSHGLLPSFLPQQQPPASHLPPTVTPPPSKPRKTNNNKMRMSERRRRKRLIFRCSACKLSFGERAECLGHVRRDHRTTTSASPRRGSGKEQKIFRCRKCSFTSGTYAKWRVHFKVHHNRPPKMFEVLGGESGVVLQRFLLGVGEDEPFVPSLVYLPVRSKVSESREVSFCLTPRS